MPLRLQVLAAMPERLEDEAAIRVAAEEEEEEAARRGTPAERRRLHLFPEDEEEDAVSRVERAAGEGDSHQTPETRRGTLRRRDLQPQREMPLVELPEVEGEGRVPVRHSGPVRLARVELTMGWRVAVRSRVCLGRRNST